MDQKTRILPDDLNTEADDHDDWDWSTFDTDWSSAGSTSLEVISQFSVAHPQEQPTKKPEVGEEFCQDEIQGFDKLVETRPSDVLLPVSDEKPSRGRVLLRALAALSIFIVSAGIVGNQQAIPGGPLPTISNEALNRMAVEAPGNGAEETVSQIVAQENGADASSTNEKKTSTESSPQTGKNADEPAAPSKISSGGTVPNPEPLISTPQGGGDNRGPRVIPNKTATTKANRYSPPLPKGTTIVPAKGIVHTFR